MSRSLLFDRVKRFWADYRWPILGALALVAVGLGYWGAARYGTDSLGDRIYTTLQLFVLESGQIVAPVPWQLEVARILAPVVAAYAAISALTPIFQEQVSRLRTRGFTRGHVLICGLGRCGQFYALAFRSAGYRVVAIESNPVNPAIVDCRRAGIAVIVGDGSSPDVLRASALRTAERIVAVSGDDGTNLAIAAAARRLTQARTKRLTCHVQLTNPELVRVLAREELARPTKDPLRLEFFSAVETGGRVLLDDFQAFKTEGSFPAEQPHLLLVGLGQMGRALLVEAARRWRGQDLSGTGRRLRVTVVERAATRHLERVLLRHPGLDSVCDVVACDLDVTEVAFQRGDYLNREDGPAVTCVFVSLGDDTQGLSAAASVRRHVASAVPVIVRTTAFTNLDELLGSGTGSCGLLTFPVFERVCRPEVLTNGIAESIARAIHEDYVRAEGLRGNTVATNPAMVDWPALPEVLKASNRDQAADIGSKLDAVACGLVPIEDWEEEPLELTPPEVEVLAVMEHDRWCRERFAAGWVLGPEKDVGRKVSPSLVPWIELSDEDVERDRAAVRAIPKILKDAGYALVPTNHRRPHV